MLVHCGDKTVKIKKAVLCQLYGHPVDVLTREELQRSLNLQAIHRSLKGKRTTTNGFKRKEMSALIRPQ